MGKTTKLTADEISKIKILLNNGSKWSDIQSEFHISSKTISKILHGDRKIDQTDGKWESEKIVESGKVESEQVNKIQASNKTQLTKMVQYCENCEATKDEVRSKVDRLMEVNAGLEKEKDLYEALYNEQVELFNRTAQDVMTDREIYKVVREDAVKLSEWIWSHRKDHSLREILPTIIAYLSGVKLGGERFVGVK